MRSIERRFKKISRKKNCWSTYVCFAEAVRGRHFSPRTIQYWFNRLVDTDDYCKLEKKQIIRHLCLLTNMLEERIK